MKHDFMMLYLAYKLELNAIAGTIPDPFEYYLEDVDAIFDEGCAVDFYPVYEDDKMVGFVAYELKNVITVHDIYVAPLHRGKGYGKKMVEFIKRFDKDIELSVINRNPAIRFWEKMLGELSIIGENDISKTYIWRKKLL